MHTLVQCHMYLLFIVCMSRDGMYSEYFTDKGVRKNRRALCITHVQGLAPRTQEVFVSVLFLPGAESVARMQNVRVNG